MKKAVTTFLVIALLALNAAYALASEPGLGNFEPTYNYSRGWFQDVPEDKWFSKYVEDAYNYGLVQGKEPGIFDPDSRLTLGEALKLVSRLRSIYYTKKADFIETRPFYSVYVEYAFENGILGKYEDYSSNTSRAQFAEMLCNALPSGAFAEINDLPDNAICDVTKDDSFAEAVYTLYRAGIMTGVDRYGTFYPNSAITRAEACAIISRVINPQYRAKTAPPEEMPGEEIFLRSADAVFMIETFDEAGQTIRYGSGFFISDTGLAATNEHVIAGAASAIATLNDGRKYPISGIRAINAETDLALISVDADEGGWTWLKLADSDSIETGSAVFTIGSPFEMINSISGGVISNTHRELTEQLFFQFSAPISFGSGGGPVLNARGQVIGIASSSYSGGQHLNLAVPVNLIKELKPGELIPLAEALSQN